MKTYWCNNCNIPVIGKICGICKTKCKEIASSEFRPVFKEEVNFIYEQTGIKLEDSFKNFIIWSSGNFYYKNGIKFAKLGYNEDRKLNLSLLKIRDSKSNYKNINLSKIEKANKTYLNLNEHNATQFIKDTIDKYNKRFPLVSFSGGKDSCVTSSLVKKALHRSDVFHIFADTTLELPDTYSFIKKFCKVYKRTPLVKISSNTDFYNLCEQIGPPSRFHRWCCTTQKTTPLGSILNAINVDNGVLVFDGIRKTESTRRSKYSKITTDTKILSQVLASPIFNWSTIEVWLYILTRKLLINNAYKKGFHRVGCFPCPLNGKWSEYLINSYYSNSMKKWYKTIRSYSDKIGRTDDEYIKSGAWKTRAGGRGISNGIAELEKYSCLENDSEHGFKLKVDWSDKYLEYLKPFGRLIPIHDDGILLKIIIRDNKETNLSFITINRLRNYININLLIKNNKRVFLQKFERQLKKIQACVKCGACISLCPLNAIRITEKYYINENDCINCLNCVTKQPNGCIAVKSLATTRKRV